MTFTHQQEHINGYYIYIQQDKYENGYVVGYCREIDGVCGYPKSERFYSTIQKAKRRFRDLKKGLAE